MILEGRTIDRQIRPREFPQEFARGPWAAGDRRRATLPRRMPSQGRIRSRL